MKRDWILKGNICHTPSAGRLEIHEDAYVVCRDGICEGIWDRFEDIPQHLKSAGITDCGGKLIIPGMTDLHIHAPQYTFRGTGMDEELLTWLKLHTFPEEIRYSDPGYARRAYGIFAEKMRKSATTRAVIFGTIHREATLVLMDLMEETGIISLVGKVSMDRDAPPKLTEKSADEAASEVSQLIRQSAQRGYRRTGPIITPRFVPVCSEELLERLGQIRAQTGIPVQSHLSENPSEVELVGRLVPEAAFYGDVYDRHGLFGGEACTIMAHCVYSVPEEIRRIRERGVWIAHCPNSNMNLSSGIAPVRRYLEAGIRVGLGTDVAAGSTESMFRAVTDAIQVSKLRWRLMDASAKPLMFSESFYLATKGGGSFFGKTGSFEPGYAFDALVLDDSVDPLPRPLPTADRLERAFYAGLDREGIVMKLVQGDRIL